MRRLFDRFGWVPLVGAAFVLFYAAGDLPRMGDPSSPASTHVSPRYIEKANEEAGAPNMVTAVLADYRSFDTLGETVVILTAGLACLLILGAFHGAGASRDGNTMSASFGSDVLDAASRLVTPFIVLFAMYVVVHGHTSPGGGFQGGAIFAAAIIFIRLVRGGAPGLELSSTWTAAIAGFGVLVYAGIGLVSIVYGASFLDYSALPLPFEGGHLRAFGSLAVKTGVFFAVTAVLVMIFDVLSAGAEH